MKEENKFLEGRAIEEKYENKINRITAKATPRPIERVVPGITFNFELCFRVFEGDNDSLFNDVVLKGLRYLELDYLGGGGSRGNGKIRFVKLKKGNEDLSLPEIEWKSPSSQPVNNITQV